MTSSSPTVRPPPRPVAESVLELDADDLIEADGAREPSADGTEEIGSAELLRVENAATALAIQDALPVVAAPPLPAPAEPHDVVLAPTLLANGPEAAPAPAVADAAPVGGPVVPSPVHEIASAPTSPDVSTEGATHAAPQVDALGSTVAAPDPIAATVAAFEGSAGPALAPPRPGPPRPDPPRPVAEPAVPVREKSDVATMIGAAPAPLVGVPVAASEALAQAPADSRSSARAPAADVASSSDALPVTAPWLVLKDRRVLVGVAGALLFLVGVGVAITGAARRSARASVDNASLGGAATAATVSSPAQAAPTADHAPAAAADPPSREAEVANPSPEAPTTAAAPVDEPVAAKEAPPSAVSPLEDAPAPVSSATRVAPTAKAGVTRARHAKTEPVPAAPTAAPPRAVAAPTSTVGTVRVSESLSVIQVDGHYVRVQGGVVGVKCGTHRIKAGMGSARTVVVPCGGVVSL